MIKNKWIENSIKATLFSFTLLFCLLTSRALYLNWFHGHREGAHTSYFIVLLMIFGATFANVVRLNVKHHGIQKIRKEHDLSY